jgi:hypothetical protein
MEFLVFLVLECFRPGLEALTYQLIYSYRATREDLADTYRPYLKEFANYVTSLDETW